MITRVQKSILFFVQANGGQWRGLTRMAAELNINYSNSARALKKLERQGLALVTRPGPGVPVVIQVKSIPSELIGISVPPDGSSQNRGPRNFSQS